METHDSISNVSKRTKGSKTSSSASSAARKAVAENAALLAKAAALKDKQPLILQEAKLKTEIETLELNAEIAASAAKVKVLQTLELYSVTQEDGMNAYLEESKQRNIDFMDPEVSPIEFMNMGAVPKTPLQRTVGNIQVGIQAKKPLDQNGSQQHDPKKHYSPSRPHSFEDSVQSLGHHDNLKERQQTDIAELIIMQQKLAMLPTMEVPIFGGDLLMYESFIQAFKHLIEDKTSSSQDRLYFLEQYTSGQPKSLVQSCLHMESHRGYEEAKRLLKEHYGDEIKISSAYLERALNWTSIKADDGRALQAYAMYLRGCLNAMQDLHYMDELDIPCNIRSIVFKLPYKLRERWRGVDYDVLQRSKRRARFQHLVEFMERHAKMLMDPLFGDIQDHQLPNKRTVPRNQMVSIRAPKSKGSSFATIVTTDVESSASPPSDTAQRCMFKLQPPGGRSVSISCTFCKGQHMITDCTQFKAHPHRKKVDFLKTNGHCFGCLIRGHLSKHCKRRLTCQKCNRSHPTILHIDYPEATTQNPQPKTSDTKDTSISSALVSAGEVVGTGKDCALAIVPVRVKVDKGDKFISTYAFLDPGSSATFCTENLMRQLNPKSRKTTVILKTMGQNRPVKSYELTGLEVGNLEGGAYLNLSKVYTQSKIPVSKDNIPTSKDLRKLPYLSSIQLKEINADIELLIGVNVPKAMEPWDIINSQENGPYAVKTMFGWVVNGPLNSCAVETGPVAMVNRIAIDQLKDLLIKQYNQDFSEKESEEKKEMSEEDRKFMEIAATSVEHLDGHYHLPLPFRHKETVMPDNYGMVEERTLNLLKRFKRDEDYAMEYKKFMEVLKKGYAEKVPLEQLKRKDGQVWYIPHHRVYHRQKGKLRVVFDCGASYKGTSLNKELLQGPDLANTLEFCSGFAKSQLLLWQILRRCFIRCTFQTKTGTSSDFCGGLAVILPNLWKPTG